MLTQIEIDSLAKYIADKAVDGDTSYKLWVKDLIEDWNDTRDISKFPYDTKDYVQMPRLKKTEDGRVIVDDDGSMNEAVMRLRSIVTDIRRTSILLNESCEDRAKELRMYAVYIDSLANGLNLMETAE